MLRKCVGKFLDCGQPYRVLHMQIVLGHIHIRVTDNALDGGKVNTQHLHLGNVGVPTAMGCQNPYTKRLRCKISTPFGVFFIPR